MKNDTITRFRCPHRRPRKPTGKGVDWFLFGRGRKRWATSKESAKIEGVSTAALSRGARAGCPNSVFVGNRRFYLRSCLGSNKECWCYYPEPKLPAKLTLKQRKAAEAERRQAKERSRRELAERRAARDRHAQRVRTRQTMMTDLKSRWQQSGAPWAVWLVRKRELKDRWEEQEALELGRDELRLAGHPLDAPGADVEALRRGWHEIGRRLCGRLCRRGR